MITKTGLLSMKIVLKPSAKNVLIPLGLTTAATSIDAARNFWIRYDNINNFELGNEWDHENS